MTIPGISGRIAVVTGASSGIGEAIARALAAAGASVVINARRTPRIERLAAELGGPARVVAVAGDASDQRVIDALLTAARDRFGEGAREADLVIVNAGRGLRGSAYDSDPGQWDELIQTNLVGAARLMRSAAQRMAGSVPIVKGPPQAAVPPTPPRDWPSQRSTKAAVHMLAESLRRLIGPRGVRVTVVEPGVVKSEFQEAAGYDADSFGRYAESISPVLSPEDVARLVLFVVSQPAGMHVCDVMVRPTRQEYP
jgi:NADP-dependent 3-hydroxy acid dehydrogenase YdfG